MEYANNAYKTAGMSANEYMSTITGFSAAMISSLGGDTAAAAEKSNMAVTDMADNANKMGSSIEGIQNAYQGFSKQNYTMLDNLKLGYGGTKEEMQRLIDKANDINAAQGNATNYTIDSYADVVDAIHTVQTEMDITGTTSKEASSTIQGSIGMMKGAWENFLTGMADPEQDFDALVNNLIDSVMTVADNLIPRIVETAPRLVEGLAQLITTLASYLPDLLKELLPALLDGATQLLNAIVEAFPELVEVLVGVLPTLVDAILNMLPMIIEAGLQIIVSLALGIADALPELIPTIVDVVLKICEILIDNLPLLVDAAIQIIMALAVGLIDALPTLIEKVPEIIVKLEQAFVDNAGKLARAAGELIVVLATGLIHSIPTLIRSIPTIVQAVFNAFTIGFKTIGEIGKNLIIGLWNGISDKIGWIKEKIKGFGEAVLKQVKDIFGIHSPSTKFKWFGKMCVEGFEQPFENYDPYKVFKDSFRANAGVMRANFLGSGASTTTNTTTQTVNIYQPVKTPSEMARAIRLEQQYGLAGA